MDHDEAVRQHATERYLLNELEPEVRDQFEDHLFDCQDCALDVRAAAMFVEQSKVVLADSPVASLVRVQDRAAAKPGWFAWFRPAFAVPVLALLLAVIGYQNFVTVPGLTQAANRPQFGPFASINVDTRAAVPAPIPITIQPGEGFSLLINLPPGQEFASYTADLYNPAQKLEWSGVVPKASAEDHLQVYIPGGPLQPGTYTLVVHGMTSAHKSQDIGRHPIDLQVQN